jgi:hypothetical protein
LVSRMHAGYFYQCSFTLDPTGEDGKPITEERCRKDIASLDERILWLAVRRDNMADYLNGPHLKAEPALDIIALIEAERTERAQEEAERAARAAELKARIGRMKERGDLPRIPSEDLNADELAAQVGETLARLEAGKEGA